jgi:hypothetical protein
MEEPKLGNYKDLNQLMLNNEYRFAQQDVPLELIQQAWDIFRIHFVLKSIRKNILSKDASLFITDLLRDQKIYEVQGDLIDLITYMGHEARERSHGAFPLSKIFISHILYKELVDKDDLSTDTVLKAGNVIICPTDTLEKGPVLGICEPKGNIVPNNLVVMLGRIQE